jgi:ferrous iron transport protein A
MIALTDMPSGQKGTIAVIDGGHGMIQKLDTLGLHPGIEITKISRQWIKGPVIIRSGHTEIAIGFGMAKKIMMDVIKPVTER